MVKLYYSPGACSLSPRIALTEAKIDFTDVKVTLNDHKLPDGSDYYKINPAGGVPAIELDDGTVISEGPAILQWIADQNPDAGLSPKKGTKEHYKFLETLNFITTEVHKCVAFFFWPGNSGDYREFATKRALRQFGLLDERLSKQKYLIGDSFTAADGYLFVLVRWCYASWTNFSIHKNVDLSEFKNLEAWYKRVLERPAVQAAVKAEGLPL